MSESDKKEEDITIQIITEFLEHLERDNLIDKPIVSGIRDLVKSKQIPSYAKIVKLIKSGSE